MLKITVVPIDGAEPTVYELDHTRFSNREAKIVERYTGLRANAFQAGILGIRDVDPETGLLKEGQAPVVLASEYSDADHQTVMVWLAMRRNGHPDLAIEDVPEFDVLLTDVDVVDDPTDKPPADAAPDPTGGPVGDPPPASSDGSATG